MTGLQALFRDAYEQDVAEPDPKVAGKGHRSAGSKGQEQKDQATLAIQEQLGTWCAQRDTLANEIKRGREFLDQVQAELTALRSGLEDWPAYERVCGVNPLPDYLESIAVKEGIERFLPGWLRRRERQLHDLESRMMHRAQENGLEHPPVGKI